MHPVKYEINDYNSKIHLDHFPYKKFIETLDTLFTDTLNTAN